MTKALMPEKCPYCDGTRTWRNGTQEGVQRYICSECNGAFSARQEFKFEYRELPHTDNPQELCEWAAEMIGLSLGLICSKSRKWDVVEARRAIAQALFFRTRLPVVSAGELLGLAPGSARLGQGCFNFF